MCGGGWGDWGGRWGESEKVSHVQETSLTATQLIGNSVYRNTTSPFILYIVGMDKSNSLLSALGLVPSDCWSNCTSLAVSRHAPSNSNYRDTPLELSAEQEGAEEASYDSAVRELQLLDDHYQNALETLHNEYEMKLRLVRGGERGWGVVRGEGGGGKGVKCEGSGRRKK